MKLLIICAIFVVLADRVSMKEPTNVPKKDANGKNCLKVIKKNCPAGKHRVVIDNCECDIQICVRDVPKKPEHCNKSAAERECPSNKKLIHYNNGECGFFECILKSCQSTTKGIVVVETKLLPSYRIDFAHYKSHNHEVRPLVALFGERSPHGPNVSKY